MLEQGAVVALVYEKSCLLTLEPVDIEFQSVFDGNVGLEATDYIVIDRVEAAL